MHLKNNKIFVFFIFFQKVKIIAFFCQDFFGKIDFGQKKCLFSNLPMTFLKK